MTYNPNDPNLPISRQTGQPSSIRAAANMSVGLPANYGSPAWYAQQQAQAQQQQSQAQAPNYRPSQPQPRQKSLSQADYAAAINNAVVKAMEPINQALGGLIQRMEGTYPPAQAVQPHPLAQNQREAQILAQGNVPVRIAARRNLGPVYATATMKSEPYIDGETARIIAKQKAVYAQQLSWKAHLARVDAGIEGSLPGLNASPEQTREHIGPLGAPEPVVHY